MDFTPGNIIQARGREWIVLSGTTERLLKVRPVSGSEADVTVMLKDLEEKIESATFAPPKVSQVGNHESARLLRDAMVLSLRRGAGPFRSFGQIAVEPRAYQLVPLLMALKQETIRLLIADDVGIGKTIESGLILRELIDRGDVHSFTVLCPPHLVEQWVEELEARFHLVAEAITDTSVRKLERALQPGESLFTAYPYTVVSLDYIKSDKRKDEFARSCPKFVIVDEAHTCTNHGTGHQKRFELLQSISKDEQRHLVLLTATPHSGDNEGFYNLLSLLKSDFKCFAELDYKVRNNTRILLAQHIVQRRRIDINEWNDNRLFARRETSQLTYQLDDESKQFFQELVNLCQNKWETASKGKDQGFRSIFGILALMRCAASSPAAVVRSLTNKLSPEEAENLEQLNKNRAQDTEPDAAEIDDLEPLREELLPLKALLERAEKLKTGEKDEKYKCLQKLICQLLDENFRPVVFCRYISTAEYLEKLLTKYFDGKGKYKDVVVRYVTGQSSSEERRACVEELETEYKKGKRPVLVATDCLSEGINLQNVFSAVVHYDLSWNPTRHEQREGRVDRFGQQEKVVRCTLMYGKNNPVDGAVLNVILNKAEKIRRELGVPVPVPDDSPALTKALMEDVFRRSAKGEQMALPLGSDSEQSEFSLKWNDAYEKAKRNHTVFAQRRIKPDEVVPEWKKSLQALGSQDDVERFVCRGLEYLNAKPQKVKVWSESEEAENERAEAGTQRVYRVTTAGLSDELKERFEREGIEGEQLLMDFDFPAHTKCMAIQRCHPMVSVLSEAFLESTLSASDDSAANDRMVLGRVGVWQSAAVTSKTIVALLRLRHQISTQGSAHADQILVEEACAIAWSMDKERLTGQEAMALLDEENIGDVPDRVKARLIEEGLSKVEASQSELEAFAHDRAAVLLEDHRRVRAASNPMNNGRVFYKVEPILPVDLVGCFVLTPKA